MENKNSIVGGLLKKKTPENGINGSLQIALEKNYGDLSFDEKFKKSTNVRTEHYDGGGWYEGEFDVNGVRTGLGVFHWSNGDYYKGSFGENGQMSGQGTYYWLSGGRLEGTWKSDKPIKGIMYYNDGFKFEGEFNTDWTRKKGTLYWPDGQRYEGTFDESGLRSGQGIFYFSNGDYYEGEYSNDQPSGQGTYYWSDGSKFIGQWLNGLRHGYGKYYDSNNKLVQEGKWVKDKWRPENGPSYFGSQYKKNGSSILSRVKTIVVNKLGVDPYEVVESASFMNDLGADSLDALELIMEFEKEFFISIPDEIAERIRTVGDAVRYLEKHV